MTKYFSDIRTQPEQLTKCIAHAISEVAKLREAAALIANCEMLWIVGIGASWNAGLAIEAIFDSKGINCRLCDASEFVYQKDLRAGSIALFLSRSGKSIEIIQGVGKCRNENVPIVSITNDIKSPLAKQSKVALHTHVNFDHSISVNTFSSIILLGVALAQTTVDNAWLETNQSSICRDLTLLPSYIEIWDANCKKNLSGSKWYYFIARGSARCSAYESRLLWEEAAKHPATALSTGSFRHGPQEILRKDIAVVIWLTQPENLQHDILLARDIEATGVRVVTVAKSFVLDQYQPSFLLPDVHEALEAVVATIPMQLAAGHFSVWRGEDPDRFRYCNFIVESEGGL
jgi:glucosamine--fructose-6-phosphate aminotransferase (isomerizing)